MDLSLLNKLLNRLKSCANFQPGGKKGAAVDFRIICGTREDVGAGATDLEEHTEFFRLLAPFQVKIPSLRNRTGDIPLLIKRFLNEIVHENESHHQTIPNVTPEAMKILKAYPWPGNVRELKNVINQTVLLHDSGRIGPEDLPPSIHALEGDYISGLNGAEFGDGIESGWNLNEGEPENQPLENHA
jgi:DNA-binding NtrC family response regulator